MDLNWSASSFNSHLLVLAILLCTGKPRSAVPPRQVLVQRGRVAPQASSNKLNRLSSLISFGGEIFPALTHFCLPFLHEEACLLSVERLLHFCCRQAGSSFLLFKKAYVLLAGGTIEIHK